MKRHRDGGSGKAAPAALPLYENLITRRAYPGREKLDEVEAIYTPANQYSYVFKITSLESECISFPCNPFIAYYRITEKTTEPAAEEGGEPVVTWTPLNADTNKVKGQLGFGPTGIMGMVENFSVTLNGQEVTAWNDLTRAHKHCAFLRTMLMEEATRGLIPDADIPLISSRLYETEEAIRDSKQLDCKNSGGPEEKDTRRKRFTLDTFPFTLNSFATKVEDMVTFILPPRSQLVIRLSFVNPTETSPLFVRTVQKTKTVHFSNDPLTGVTLPLKDVRFTPIKVTLLTRYMSLSDRFKRKMARAYTLRMVVPLFRQLELKTNFSSLTRRIDCPHRGKNKAVYILFQHYNKIVETANFACDQRAMFPANLTQVKVLAKSQMSQPLLHLEGLGDGQRGDDNISKQTYFQFLNYNFWKSNQIQLDDVFPRTATINSYAQLLYVPLADLQVDAFDLELTFSPNQDIDDLYAVVLFANEQKYRFDTMTGEIVATM